MVTLQRRMEERRRRVDKLASRAAPLMGPMSIGAKNARAILCASLMRPAADARHVRG